MFVDASAIVAILKREHAHAALSQQLDAADRPMTSALAMFESVLALARARRPQESSAAQRIVEAFFDRTGIEIVPIDGTTGRLALEAHARYGKGSGHPARLNLGDCFAYAMARQHGVPLLYKGDDFTSTDLA